MREIKKIDGAEKPAVFPQYRKNRNSDVKGFCDFYKIERKWQKKWEEAKVFEVKKSQNIENSGNYDVKMLAKTPPFKVELHLEHPKIPNKPRLLRRGKTQGFFDTNSPEFSNGQFSKSGNTVKRIVHKKKFYALEMYPYPSASGLHIGHAFNYIIGDILARFKRMQGLNVLYPVGYDSFGLPAENAAIKAKSHPRVFTDKAIKNFMRQQKSLGLSYDWSRKIQSHELEYYKWNQFFFLQFLKKGLAYRKKAPVNWCPLCKTVLANEQVHDGKCWRHPNTNVEIKHLEQWFIKTTAYAEELLQNIEKLNWPERIKIMQENWIGKSKGTEIIFEINNKPWKIFTTRPDTLFGVTFMVISAQHPELMELVTDNQKEEVELFLKKLKSTKQEDLDKLEKEGVFTGSYAKNPLTNEKISVYTGNFVLAEYGSGMVMAVPAHDQRDFEFAKKYALPIKIVISPENKKLNEKFAKNKLLKEKFENSCVKTNYSNFSDEKIIKEAYEGPGILINSEGFNGLFSEEAKVHITKALEYKNLGRERVQYKLRDWLISRQRYWGTPIPVIYCGKCGVVPLPENELPVKLPEKVKFGKGNPMGTSKNFVNISCPKCKGKAKRETDTMDTFFDSSWYFLRFTDSKNEKEPFNKETAEYWMPVDFYIGGTEHACMHLIYARFFTKALRDLGMINISEPFTRLFNQGMIHGEDGYVMSKSRGNVVDPLDITRKYGADALRIFLVSVASPDKDSSWSSSGIEGSYKLINKIFNYIENFMVYSPSSMKFSNGQFPKKWDISNAIVHATKAKIGESSPKLEHKINKAIKEITEDIKELRYNLAVIKIRGLLEAFEEEQISIKDLESFVKLIAPFCPHIAEELWEKIGGKGFVSLAEWPEADESKISNELEEQEKALEKTIEDIKNILNLIRARQGKESEKIYIYAIPKEISAYDAEYLERRLNKKITIFAVNDSRKYDPEGKAQRAKPGKPGIYVE